MKRFPSATISHPSAETCADELLDVIPSVMKAIRTQMRRHSAALPSVVHFRALAFINREPDPDVSGVASHIGLMLPSASKLVQSLHQRGYVRRSPDPADRRRTMLRPTAKGRRVVTTARQATRQYLANLLATFDPDARATVARSMRSLRPIFLPQPPATSAATLGRAPLRSKTRTTAS